MIPHFAQQTEWTGTDLNKYLSASRDNTATAFYFQNLHDSKISGEILKSSYFKIQNILTLIDNMNWFEDEFKMQQLLCIGRKIKRRFYDAGCSKFILFYIDFNFRAKCLQKDSMRNCCCKMSATCALSHQCTQYIV